MTDAARDRFMLTAPVLFRGGRGEIVRDAAVLIVGTTIEAVGDRAAVEAQLGARPALRRDFPGATMLPGLIDAHVHLAFAGPPARLDALLDDPDDEKVARKMVSRGAAMLRHGVTTVRDLADRDYLAVRLREAIAAGEVAGPRVLAAGVPLTVPDGHCHALGGVVRGIEDIRERVAHSIREGVDVIKIMASGGQMTQGSYRSWESQFSVEELRAAVDLAHEHGLPVAAHAHGAESIGRAVAAGVDTVEHGGWLVGERSARPRPEVAAQMAEQGTVFCHASPNNWRRMVSLGVEERWARQMVARLGWFHDHGVTLINGTDAGISAFNNTATALLGMEELGFTPDHIVEIGTRAVAAALGLAGRTGSLQEGLAADVLVVDGDLSSDTSALTRPLAVFCQGREARTEADVSS